MEALTPIDTVELNDDPAIVVVSSDGTDPSESASDQDRYVVFDAAGVRAAFPISSVRKIERLPLYTSLPNMPEWCLGISNIRGEIISLTDLAALAQISNDDRHSERKVIVVHDAQSNATTAVVVDRVVGIRRCQSDALRSLDEPNTPITRLAGQIAATDQGDVLMIRPDRLFAHPEMKSYMTT